ncbi:hypothetical protein AI2905V1_3551 [Enterobacter cloacae]|nr:hypothetical protein AI2905V1_3551 [Enterobacter cloacae]CAH5866727.1 hypothetical protein AI2916V1_1311 [Enterobacter cloacae]CAH5899713.1 hypothetical protein AI2905V1_3551 [Enterobacter cloacae]
MPSKAPRPLATRRSRQAEIFRHPCAASLPPCITTPSELFSTSTFAVSDAVAAMETLPSVTAAPARPPAILTRLLTSRFSSAVRSLDFLSPYSALTRWSVIAEAVMAPMAPAFRPSALLPPLSCVSAAATIPCSAARAVGSFCSLTRVASRGAAPAAAPAFRLPPSAPASNPAAALPLVQKALPGPYSVF